MVSHQRCANTSGYTTYFQSHIKQSILDHLKEYIATAT
nr:MAG TPA: hypothetical protein [Caudoviricetes sp.]